MVFQATIFVSLFYLAHCKDVILSDFIKDEVCDVTDRIDKGCSKEVTGVGSFIHCAALCGRDESCIGASLDETGKCFLHQPCHEIGECTVVDRNHHYMSKSCVNGTWDDSSHTCSCAYGFHGDRCEKYPHDCKDLISAGYSEGMHRVYIDRHQDRKNPILVNCHIYPSTSYAKINFMSNQGRQLFFNKTWDEYAKGFYLDEFNYWIGLDALHILTNSGCPYIMTLLEMNLGTDRGAVSRDYNDFVVSDSSMKYTFTYGNTSQSGNGQNPPDGVYFGECLNSLKNTPFSTWDNDNDGDDSENCASRAGSGWWYSGCISPCNFLGLGFDYWDTKPKHQLYSLEGVVMDNIAELVEYILIYVRCQ